MIQVDPHHIRVITERARKIMEQQQIDVLVASSPENFYYVSGYSSAFLYTMRMKDIALAVLFRNPNRDTILIMNDFEAFGVPAGLPRCEVRTYPTWVDVDDPLGLRGEKFNDKRPVVPQVKEMFAVLAEVLAENGLSGGKAAVELNHMLYPTVVALKESCRALQLSDAAGLFTELRSVKTEWEVAQLRKACVYTEAGIERAMEGIGAGSSAADIVQSFRASLTGLEGSPTPRFHMVSVGANFAPVQHQDYTPAKSGDLIKLDVGVEVAGYGSDIARTFVLGPPTPLVRQIYDALRKGHDRLLQMMEPGIKMSRLFDEVMPLICRSGLQDYNRGHLGHSIGLGLSAEEPPFISPSETTILQPGMVICLETPYYGYGIGSIMIEDMVLVTDNGCERLNRLSRDLISL